MDREELKAAVDSGIITEEQAKKMAESSRQRLDGSGEDEAISFVSNLNDVFLSFGLVILFLGLIAGAAIMSFGAVGFQHFTPVVSIPLAVIAWFFAEYFVGRRKLLLPGIVLSSLFCFFVFSAATSFVAWLQIDETVRDATNNIANTFPNPDDVIRDSFGDAKTSLWVGCLSSFCAAFAFYLRFRLPFTMFLMAGSILIAAFGYAFGFVTLVITGTMTLIAAIAFDARDPERETRQSANGFWLHVAAAPQLVYGIRGILDLEGGASDSMTMIAVLSVLALLSLLLNRRALILSGLLSFGFAVWSLFQIFGDSLLMQIASPLLVFGGLIVLLGSGWRTARRALLVLFPSTGIWSRIFPPEPRLNV